MSQLYCPDCGGSYTSGDTLCPECEFPLQIEVVAQGQAIMIEPKEAVKWKRLAPLLKRNGLDVVTRHGSGLSSHSAWWALPSIGAMIFIVCLVFGADMVDMIWEPPRPVAPILDMNNPGGIAETDADTGNPEDVSYLTDAFSTSDEQRQMTSDQNLDLEQYVDRIEVPESTIRDYMRQSWVSIDVDGVKGVGTWLGIGNYFIMEATLSDQAYRREIRNVATKGVLKEEAVYIVPMVGFYGQERVGADRKRKADHMTFHLMTADLPAFPQFQPEFERELTPNSKVWVARPVDGTFYTEQATVIDGLTLGRDVNVWVIDSELDSSLSGAPVFDDTGKLTGIFLVHDGQNAVLSLRTIRERSPLIYKELQ